MWGAAEELLALVWGSDLRGSMMHDLCITAMFWGRREAVRRMTQPGGGQLDGPTRRHDEVGKLRLPDNNIALPPSRDADFAMPPPQISDRYTVLAPEQPRSGSTIAASESARHTDRTASRPGLRRARLGVSRG